MFRAKSYMLTISVALFALSVAANAWGDFITYTYDFDRCTSGQKLNTQDGWKKLTAVANENTFVLSGAAGWLGNYASATVSGTSSWDCTLQRVNDAGWSFSIVPNWDFEVSAMFLVGASGSTTGFYAHVGIGKYKDDASYPQDLIYFGAQYQTLRWWSVDEGIALSYTHGITSTTGKMFNIGVEMKAKGSNKYDMQAFYQNITDGGTRQYFDTPKEVTVDVAQWDDIFVRTYLRYVSSSSIWAGRVDTISITTVPEPSTAIIFLVGLLGMIAYAWRKQK